MMLSTCACTDTSSAEVGSSQTRNSGCVASARAIEMRWRCPPENWCGNFSMSALARPTDCSSSPTLLRSPASSVNRPCSRSGSPTMSSTFQRGLRLAYGSWKIICMRRRKPRRLAADDLSTPGVLAVEEDRAARRLVQPDQQPRHRALAAAGFAHQRQRLALVDAEADAVHRMHELARLALDDAVEPRRATHRRSSPGRRP